MIYPYNGLLFDNKEKWSTGPGGKIVARECSVVMVVTESELLDDKEAIFQRTRKCILCQ